MMNSIAIQLCLFLLLLASIVLSFMPWIQDNFFTSDPLKLKVTDIAMEEGQLDNVELVEKNPDVEIVYQKEENSYLVTFYTQHGKNGAQTVDAILTSCNLMNLAQTASLSEQDMMALQNQNISFVDKTDSKTLTEEQNIFLMAIVLMFFLMATILISRIGAQVAYEKGNMVTEVILTSITPGQLFLADAISSAVVVILNVVVISLPMIIASLIGDRSIVSDFSFLNGCSITLIILHLILCVYSLIVLCIALCSISKRAEDSNAYATIMLMPVMVSYLYTIFTHDIFKNVWSFLNYIPFCSVFPILAGIITTNVSTKTVLICIVADVIFLSVELLFCKRIYTKNISKI